MICYADHCAGTLASSRDAAEPVQAGRRAVPRHRRPLEPRRVRRGVRRVRRLSRPSATGTSKLGLGRQKIFEVRRIHNDLTFIDEFLTLDFCRQHKLFSFGFNEDSRLLRDREPRVREDQAAAAVQSDERRPADHLRAGRQLQEPRRAVPGAPLQRRRAADRTTPRTRWPTCTSSGSGRCTSKRTWKRPSVDLVVRRARAFTDRRSKDQQRANEQGANRRQ